MENNFSIIISTCDKFSDLWDAHVLLLNQNWADRNVETFLVTDKPTDRTFENVTVVAAGEGTEITERLRAVMPLIKTEYVLFTLDDYFLTERISTQAINEDIQIMEKHQIDYLRLFVMTMKSLRNRKAEELEPDIFLLDNYAGDYIVSLYAGIWRKDFMEKTGLSPEQIMYAGDDIPDYEVMTRVGLPVAPADAAPEIKEIAKYISSRRGGEGVARDVIEQTMRAQGHWFGEEAFGW